MKQVCHTHSILVVDADRAFRSSVAGLLRTERCECSGVADASQAVALLHSTRYDVLIADVHVPGNEDLHFVHEASQIAPGMPVILVSGAAAVESVADAFRLPVVAFLTKPFEEDLLKGHVQQALRHSKVYATVCRVLRHLGECVHDLKEVEHGHLASRTTPRSATVAIPQLTIRLLASCLSELLSLEAGLNLGKGCGNLCRLLDCPQRPIYRDAMHDTITVLERTKGTFKSREIGQLRIRLEQLLEESSHFNARA